MSTCQMCHEVEAVWAWQPFGPSDDLSEMAFIGNHYRGFAVIKICNQCRLQIAGGSLSVPFRFGKNYYVFCDGKIYESPF